MDMKCKASGGRMRQASVGGSVGITESVRTVSNELVHLRPRDVRAAVSSLLAALKLYGPEGVTVAFNGGKDATVVLALYCAALAHTYAAHTYDQNGHSHGQRTANRPLSGRHKPRAVWFHDAEEFEVVEAFVRDQADLWDLDLLVAEGRWDQEIDRLVRSQSDGAGHPAFVLGVRNTDMQGRTRGDPQDGTEPLAHGADQDSGEQHGGEQDAGDQDGVGNVTAWGKELTATRPPSTATSGSGLEQAALDAMVSRRRYGVFEPSSTEAPFMRVHPIIEWTYGMVWDCIALMQVPYCSLYDTGYTSIGKLDSTAKNEHLKDEQGNFRHASQLCPTKWSSERDGREL